MKAWLDSLQQSEKIMIVAGLVIVILLLIFEFIWTPLQYEITQLEQRNLSDSNKLVQLQLIISEYQQSRLDLVPLENMEMSLFALIDKTTKTGNLKSAIKSMNPDGVDAIRVTLNTAKFDLIIKWLVNLSVDYGVRADTVRMQASDNSGYADVELKLQRISG